MYHTAFSDDPNVAARCAPRLLSLDTQATDVLTLLLLLLPRGVPTVAIKLTGVLALVLISVMQAWSSKAGTRAQLVLTVFKVRRAVILCFYAKD